MPLTQLDATPALIVIDLQNAVVALPTVHPAAEVTARAAQLARAFRERGFPVVVVNVVGAAPGRRDINPQGGAPKADGTLLVPELGQQPQDYLVSKQRWGAFHGTSLDDFLKARGVTQVVITGISTSKGVESTARSAHDLGYHVVLVEDATTDTSAHAHRHSFENIFPHMSEVTTTDEVLRRMAT